MATKKQLIYIITEFLKGHPEKELYTPRQTNKLRNGRWGMHCYCLCYREGKVCCRPWAGADTYWDARLERLNKNDLSDLVGRCIMLTNPKHQ